MFADVSGSFKEAVNKLTTPQQLRQPQIISSKSNLERACDVFDVEFSSTFSASQRYKFKRDLDKQNLAELSLKLDSEEKHFCILETLGD